MPNVSASLSDAAYIIWKNKEGKRSPWVSELIVKGDAIMIESEAKSLRIGHLQNLLSQAVLQLDLARGGMSDENWTRHQKILFNECLEALEGSIHRFHLNDYKEV
jgi:hypothetical protein